MIDAARLALRYAPGVRQSLKHPACLLLCIVALGSAQAWAQSDAPAQSPDKVRLLAAQEQLGLWVIVPDQESGFELLHQPTQAPRDTLYKAMPGKDRPIALAVTANEAYVVYIDRTVQSVRFHWSARQGMHAYETEQRPPLPPDAELLGFAARGEEPLALIAVNTEAGAREIRLLAYRKGGWTRIALPQAIGARPQLVVLGEAEHDIALVDPNATDGLAVYRQQTDGWQRTAYRGASVTNDTRAVGVMGHIVLVDPPKPSDDPKPGLEVLLNATLLHTDGRVLDAGALPLPASPNLQHVPMAHADSLRVISQMKEGNLFVTDRSLFAHPDHAVAFAPLKVTNWPPVSSRELVVTGLLIVMTLVIIAIWRRDPDSAVVRLPEGLVPAALPVRLSAALFDMAPAVVVSMVVFKVSNPLEILLPWPSFDQPLDQMLPGVVAFAVFAAHTTLGELTTGMSLGKRIMHCRVTSTTGGRPSTAGVLIRGVVRLVELFAWPLLLFVLLNRPHQRMGDLAARTVVVMHGSTEQPQTPPQG